MRAGWAPRPTAQQWIGTETMAGIEPASSALQAAPSPLGHTVTSYYAPTPGFEPGASASGEQRSFP